MPAALETLRVFVSSTFKDIHAERDHLVTVVFPELRERLERLGLDFYDVDLRWGVPKTGVDGERSNPWLYCKRSINAVEPFFISILGQRYGQIPSAEEIDDDSDRTEFADMSITEMEIRHAVLSHRLSRRSFFYFRTTAVPMNGTPPDIYKEFVDHDQQVYLEKFKKQIQEESGRPVRFYECCWTGKGFSELDDFGRMVLEDLWSGVLRDERYVSKDAWRQVCGHDPDADRLYTNDSQPIPQELWQQIVEHAKPAPRDPLDVEVEGMAAFAASRLRWFQGRGRELQRLQQFIDGDLLPEASRLCVVKAIAGQGKSALLAKFAGVVADSPHLIITHFVGATERSADTRSLLERLVRELDRNGIPKPPEEDFKEDPESLKKQLAARLESYEGGRRIVLLIDAVNQLTAGHDLTWLPLRLGSNVRIVISCIDDPSSSADSPEARVMSALQGRKPEPRWVDLTPLDEEDVRGIIDRHLLEYCRKLDSKQIEDICRIDQARNPLYLLVILHALRLLPGEGAHLKVPDIIANLPVRYPDTVSLFDWILDRLEVFGKETVRLWFIYLSLGRVGMSGRELSELLARKLGKDGALMARHIERGIRQYLQRRGAQWDFFHVQLRQAVVRRYLPEDTSPYHVDIAAYLETWRHEANVHALSELPYHQTCAELWDELEKTVTDLRFIEAKCAAGMTYDLVADYDAALDALPEAQEEKQKELKHEERVRKYTEDLIAYAQGEISSLKIIPCIEPWNEERIREDTQRIINNPTLLDRIRAFSQFVNSESHALVKFASHMGFILQQAYNSARSGPVASAAESIVNYRVDDILILQHQSQRPDYNPHPVLLKTLEGHTEHITSVSITPDGKIAVSGSLDGTVRVWDLEHGICLRTLEGITYCFRGGGVTPDGKRAVLLSEDGLRVWDLEDGGCLGTLEGFAGNVDSVCITPDGKTAFLRIGDNMQVWDLEGVKCLKTISLQYQWPDQPVGSTVHITANEKKAIIQSNSKWNNALGVWSLESGIFLQCLYAGFWVNSVSITPDGKRAVLVTNDDILQIWDLKSGICSKKFKSGGEVNVVRVTPDGKRAVSGGNDYLLKVWDLESGKYLPLHGHMGPVDSVSITPDGRRAASGSRDHTVRVWDLERGVCFRTSERHADWVYSLSVAPDGKTAVSGSRDATLRVWDFERGVCSKTLKSGGQVNVVRVTPDGKTAVSGGGDFSLRVWDLESGECLRTIERDAGGIWSLSITPEGKRAVSGSWRSSPWVLDLDTGECLKMLEEREGVMYSVSVTPDGKRAVSTSGHEKNILQVWNLVTGECIRTLEGHTSQVKSVSVTPDGKKAVSISLDGTICVWNLRSGECIRTSERHGGSVNGLSNVNVAPDGKIAVSASEDGTLRVWDLDSGEYIAICQIESGALSVSEIRTSGRFACGTRTGEVILFTPQNLPMEPPIATPFRIWLHWQTRRGLLRRKRVDGRWEDDTKALCQWCGQRFPVADDTLDVIAAIARDANISPDQSPCLELPSEAWDEPRLLFECPHCHKPLRFNPFIVDNRARY